MKHDIGIISMAILLIYAYVVFRIIVRRDYRIRGRLTMFSSLLQFMVFIGYFSFGYLFNPPEWVYFWQFGTASSRGLYLAGFIVTCIGLLVSFGTMSWFGIRRAFGVHVSGLKKSGPYKLSRNPQVIGGFLMVIGISLQWPSLPDLLWILVYAIITGLMIRTEEEHLHRMFGDEYEAYCREVPRYLPFFI